MPLITPVECVDGYYFKRDDRFTAYGLSGAKVRGAEYLIRKGYREGYRKFTTVGHRKSPQIHIVGTLCKKMGLAFTGHTPQGELPEAFNGFNIVQHRAGYNNVIAARCHTYAKENGYYEIPFGMIDMGVIDLTSIQTFNVPLDTKRVVIPVGSGVNLCGILKAFRKRRLQIPIVGVVVGKSPVKLLDAYALYGWQSQVTLVDAKEKYSVPAKVTEFCGIELDPIYEAKCLPFIKEGDLFWIIGIRNF